MLTPDQGLQRMNCTPILSVGVQKEDPYGFKCAIMMPIRKLIREDPALRERLKKGIVKAIDDVVDSPMDDMTLMGEDDEDRRD